MSLVRIRTDQDAVLNAAEWLRQHLAIPDYNSVDTEFEQYFGCRIRRVPPDDFVFGEVYAEFDEQTAAMFLLRWS